MMDEDNGEGLGYRFIRAFRRQPLLVLCQVIVFVIMIYSFASIMYFLNVVGPDEAIAKYGKPLPPGCHAGVMNHGKYTCWWFPEEQPVLYYGSFVVLFAAAMFLYTTGFYKRGRWRK